MFLDILQNALYIHSFLFFSLTILLIYLLCKAGIFVDKLSKKVSNLASIPITREMVEDLITHIDIKHIPHIWYTHRLIKGAYKLILIEENLDEQLKYKLKRKLLSKGILVDWRRDYNVRRYGALWNNLWR